MNSALANDIRMRHPPLKCFVGLTWCIVQCDVCSVQHMGAKSESALQAAVPYHATVRTCVMVQKQAVLSCVTAVSVMGKASDSKIQCKTQTILSVVSV
jgi:hypothetical protein